MLKYNKFLLGLLTTLGFATASLNTNAEIVDTLEFGSDFYLLESLESQSGNTYTLHGYDMTTNATSATQLFQLPDPPTAMAYDGTNFYISAASQLRAYNAAGQSDFVRNLVTDAKDVIAAGNFLVLLLGAPANEIIVVNKNTGVLIDRTPQLPVDDMFPMHGIYYDADDNRIVAQLEDSGDSPGGSQYMAATFNVATGALGDLTTMPFSIAAVNSEGNVVVIEAPTELSEPFFLDDLEMAMDSTGSVVDFSGPNVVFSHGDQTSVAAVEHFINPFFNNSTDNVIDFATDDNTYAYFTMTLDNECNTYAEPGGSRIARWYKENSYLKESWEGFLVNTTHYYDTQNAIHTLATNGTNVYLFYGEGSNMAVEVIDDSDFSYPYAPWSDDSYNPATANISAINQKTSFTLKDGTTLAMQMEDGCNHYVGFWDTTTNSFVGHTETFWFDAIDAAYVPSMNRYFIAFTDGTNFWIRNLSTNSFESDVATSIANTDRFGTDEIHQLVDAGNYLVGSVSLAAGDDIIFSAVMRADPDDITGIGALDLDLKNAATASDASLLNCCDSWTSAVYREIDPNVTGRIYYTTSEGLFAINIAQADGSFSGPVNAGEALQSIHYGSTHTIPDNPQLALSSSGAYLFVDGQVYDSETLMIVDSVDVPANVGLFLDNLLFTFDMETSTYNTMTFNLGGGGVVGPADEGTDVTGTLAALLPISSGGSIVPLTLSTTSNGTLVVTKNCSQTSTAGGGGVSGGGSGDEGGDDDSGDTGGGGSGCEVTNQCVQAPGGGGGGPVDLLLLLGLTGLGIRQLRKLNRHL